MVTTFSDELMLMTNGKAKIFGVSVKDRGAVTLAGHTGKALKNFNIKRSGNLLILFQPQYFRNKTSVGSRWRSII